MKRLLPLAMLVMNPFAGQTNAAEPEALADAWTLVGEAINEPGWDVWGSSPVMTDDGKVHLFAARWDGRVPFDRGWRTVCEIARYVGDGPEGPFRFAETVLKPGQFGPGWQAQGFHNPNVRRIGDRFALVYIANSGEGPHGPNQRIGMVVADSVQGPWRPAGDPAQPLLAPPGDPGIWCHASGCGVNNPSLLAHPDGLFLLYFKAMNGPRPQGRVRMGVAVADQLEGPYVMHPEPITANDRVIEDGYAFLWRGKVCLLTTDNHGMLEKGGGLLWVSDDGIRFRATPLRGFHHFGNHYFPQGVPKTAKVHYTPQVKFERPQVLVIDGEPAYLYAPSGVAVDGSDGTNAYVLKRAVAP